jgi:MFS family permease
MPSLIDLGLAKDAITAVGLNINSWQLAGIITGSYAWGVLGDKFGRKSCLLASILIYSLATLYCSIVDSVDHYRIARAIAGFGIGGELGMGITLISEKLTAARRGHGVGLFFILGYSGVLIAAFVSEQFSWRSVYLIGGIAGLVLLLSRVFLLESGLYQQMAERKSPRGGLGIILRRPALLKKYFAAIFIMTTFTFTPQIMWTLAPELARAQKIAEPVKGSLALLLGFGCGIIVNCFASFLSQKLRSRRKAILVFSICGVVVFLKYIFLQPASIIDFYATSSLLGFFTGAWVVAGALIAEQFGTNIRATAVTTIPNLARGLARPMNLGFAVLSPNWGAIPAIGVIGTVVFASALWGWFHIDETYGKDLNYEEL